MQIINNFSNIRFGLLDKKLESKMKNAIARKNSSENIKDIKNTRAYRNFRYIQNHTKNSLLFEYNIADKIGTIYDLKGTMKSIDISSAYKEKNKTSRYLKIIKIIADSIKNSKQD